MHADKLIVTFATTDGDKVQTFNDVTYLHTWNRLLVTEQDGTVHRIDKMSVVNTEAHKHAAAVA